MYFMRYIYNNPNHLQLYMLSFNSTVQYFLKKEMHPQFDFHADTFPS